MTSDLTFKGSDALRLYSCEVSDLRDGEDVCWSFWVMTPYILACGKGK